MSSSAIPGSIPLPPAPSDGTAASNNGSSQVANAAAAAAVIANGTNGLYSAQAAMPAATYDPQTLAYYQAYQQLNQYQYYNSLAAGAAAAAAAATSGAHQQRAANAKHQAQASGGSAEEDEDDPTIDKGSAKASNVLPLWGNEKTMNLNPLLLTNIQSSPYFKVTLFALKTYHEVVDEIWYNVKHLEPWEPGSRKASIHC